MCLPVTIIALDKLLSNDNVRREHHYKYREKLYIHATHISEELLYRKSLHFSEIT